MLLFILLFACTLLLGIFLHAYVRMGVLPSKGEFARYESFDNFKDGRFINDEPTELAAGKKEMSKVIFRLFGRSENAPQTPMPCVRLSKNDFNESMAGDSLIWLGHSMMIFELSGKRFITDPVFGNAAPLPFIVTRYCESPISRDDLPPLDFVLISHDHYDHLEYETVRHFKNTDVRFITSLGVGARLRGWGIPSERITELNWNDSVEVGGIKITSLRTRHFSGRSPFDRDKTLWASFMIESGGRKIYFGADSGYGRHYREIGAAHGPFDLVLLEADAWNERWPNNHLFPAEMPLAYNDLGGKGALMPIHWGVFDLAMHPFDESLNAIKENASRGKIPLLLPKMGERVPIPDRGD